MHWKIAGTWYLAYDSGFAAYQINGQYLGVWVFSDKLQYTTRYTANARSKCSDMWLQCVKKKKKSSTYFEVFAYNLLKKMDLQTRHAVSGRGTGGDDDTKKKMMGEEHDLPHQEMTNDDGLFVISWCRRSWSERYFMRTRVR